MKRIRVLQIIQNLNYGGMERLLSEIVRRVDRDRFECHVLVLQYLGRFAEGLGAQARVHVQRSSRGWSMLWPRGLARRIRQIAPDVVHSHSGVWYKASLASHLAGVPRVVHTQHGYALAATRTTRFLDRLAAGWTDVVVAVSEPLRDELIHARVVRDPRHLRVVLNGVDTDLFRPRAELENLRAELGLEAGSPVIGSVGRLEPVKAYEVMISAFRRLQDRWAGEPPALVLVGEGSERARLDALAGDLGVREGVHLLGWRDDIQELHALFTLFSLSSRSEGTSVSLLEAMSSGLCPVVTDVGGNPAVLGEELKHRLVRPGDPEALAETWADALRDSNRRAADARKARARVVKTFGVEAMVRKYERIYLDSKTGP